MPNQSDSKKPYDSKQVESILKSTSVDAEASRQGSTPINIKEEDNAYLLINDEKSELIFTGVIGGIIIVAFLYWLISVFQIAF